MKELYRFRQFLTENTDYDDLIFWEKEIDSLKDAGYKVKGDVGGMLNVSKEGVLISPLKDEYRGKKRYLGKKLIWSTFFVFMSQ